jgi:hypothetical protein
MTQTETTTVKLVKPFNGYTSGYLMRTEETESGDARYWLLFGFACGHQVAFTESELAPYCVDCGSVTELDCICDDLNFADRSCGCGAHNEC